MRSKRFACLVASIVSGSCLQAASVVDPCQVIQGLRAQMKQLKTIKAQYTVDSLYGPSRSPMKSRVVYVKDGDKFSIAESLTDPNGRRQLKRTVYDGIDIKLFAHLPDEPGPPRGVTLPADHKDVTFTDDDLLRVAGFSLVAPGSDARFAQFAYERRDAEAVDGHDCLQAVFIAPYLPGQKAFNYYWIETRGAQYMLRRDVCLIDDKPDRLLIERQYGYNSSAGYPFPTQIAYRRYDIDSQGRRNLGYDKQIRVQSLRINEPIDPCEFDFTFPEGTVVHMAPPTASRADLKNSGPSLTPERPSFDPNLSQPDPRTEFDFSHCRDMLFVPVRFGPGTRNFILDTGGTVTIFDLSFRPELGAPQGTRTVSTAGNPAVMQVFAAPRAFVGPFNIADCREVACANLKSFAPVLWREVHGILGMDLLRKHIVRIDFDEYRIAFLDEKPTGLEDWGQPLPISYDRLGAPQIRVTVDGQREQDFIIDTGYSFGGALAKESFVLLTTEGGLKPISTEIGTAAGTTTSRQVRSGRVVVGPYEHRGLIFNEGPCNILGLDFLSRYVVTFDFPHDKLYLRRGRNFDKADEAGMCGVGLARLDGRTLVVAVYERSPAAKAGIKVGDVLLQVQGRDVSTYDRWEMRDLLRSGAGKEITLVLQRGADTIDVSLRLEREI